MPSKRDTTSKQSQNYINHIAMVLDMSGSMWPHRKDLITVADGQITHLAQRSKELDQETRVTVYTFSNIVECVVYDKDVLRLPSIAKFYDPHGGTALRDATGRALIELAETPERYGDHAFLIYVLTDGEENSSKLVTTAQLNSSINALPDHWTVAALVPHALGKHEAKQCGFPADNIAIWNPDTAAGVTEVGATIRQATESFMTNRAKGVRGSKSIFSIASDVLNTQTVAAAGLTPLDVKAYDIIHIDPKLPEKTPVREYVEDILGLKFRTGSVYYELTQSERIQLGKEVLVQNKKTGHVYGGQNARDLLGLPDMNVTVKPDGVNKDFRVLIQSKSTNRHMDPNTTVLIMK
jgi:hypothetical protein